LKKRSYSIIIPVLNSDGNENLESLLKSISIQHEVPTDVHLIVGDSRQGRAINFGVERCGSVYIATLDDDSIIDDSDLFMKLLNALEDDFEIGVCGAACEIPKNASWFQRKAMLEIPRRYFPIQEESRISDMVQHPCLMMRKELFTLIGGEDAELIRGLDPVLRKKVRDIGKKSVIVANTWIYHLIPDGFSSLLRMYYRNGRGSGYASRNYPERVIELTDGYDDGEFQEKRTFMFRVMRRILSFLKSLLLLKLLKCSTDIAYSLGVMKEKLFPSYIRTPEVKEIITDVDEESYPFKLFTHRVILDEE